MVMDSSHTGKLLQQLRHVLQPQMAEECADGELLERFAGTRDEAAFTALMRKHGRLVWQVCRRVLDHEHDAEDAFQGTFLVLARKAAAIRKQRSVASWLYGVAFRVSHKAKVAAARRRKHERRATPMSAQPSCEMAWRELQAILDEELQRLPEKYRAPFVLCCLEGKTKLESAGELGWKEGTVSSRLAAARKLLQSRLARRGVMLSALLSGAAVSQSSAAPMPVGLAAATAKAALAFVAGQAGDASSLAVELAQNVLRGMAAVRLKVSLVLLVLLSIAGTSVWAVRRAQVEANTEVRNSDPDQRVRTSQVTAAIVRPGPPAKDEQILVAGRVLGADGRPLARANVSVVSGELRQAGERGPESSQRILKSGQADDRGEFRLVLKRPSPVRHFNVRLLAGADGHAPSWFALSASGNSQLQCELKKGEEVRGRLLDERGQAAAGVRLQVVGMGKRIGGNVFLRKDEKPGAWLPPVLTDEAGEFAFHSISPDCELDLQIADSRFAPQWLVFKPGRGERAKPVTFTLQPRRMLHGTIICADTRRPMPGAHLMVSSTGTGASPLFSATETTADEQGRFQLAPFPGQELNVTLYPPAREPYRVIQRSLRWPAGAARHEVQFPLPRGVVIRGRVVEAESGMPVPEATIDYEPRTQDNPYARNENGIFSSWWLQDARSSPDGAFEIVVPPGPGWLLIKGSTQDYIHVPVSARQLECRKRGGNRYFPDALVPLSLDSDTSSREVLVPLRRGVTLTGKVLAHDGSPAPSAFLLAPTYRPQKSALRGNSTPARLAAADGRFELPGCHPTTNVPVLFFDAKLGQGAVAEVSGNSAQEKIVRLAPCGSATLRFVDSARRPIAKPNVQLHVLLQPGADLQESIAKEVDACLTAPVERLWGFSCVRAEASNGTLTFTHLIPGATYLVQADEGNGMVHKAVISVQPGQCLQMPDVVLRTAPSEKG
jgi:RNA polymerase sigma factor (sigma-70 family)